MKSRRPPQSGKSGSAVLPYLHFIHERSTIRFGSQKLFLLLALLLLPFTSVERSSAASSPLPEARPDPYESRRFEPPSPLRFPVLPSNDKKGDENPRLRRLQIEEFKRVLRLSEEIPEDLSQPLKEYNEARFEKAIEEIQRLPPGKKRSAADLLYGNALLLLGEKEKAVEAYQQAFRRAAVPEERAAAMANFGVVFSTRGAWKEAIDWIERALKIDRAVKDWTAQGIDLSLLGAFYLELGDAAKASAAHIEALEIAETVPIPWLEARQSAVLGNLYYQDGILNTAQEYSLKALRLYRTLGDPMGEAASLTGLSFIHKDRKELDRALAYQSEALALYEKLNDPPAEATALINLGLIHQERGEIKAAIRLGEKALRIQEGFGNLNGMAHAEGTLGTFYQTKGDLEEAVRHLEKARELFQKAGASQQIHIVDLKIQMLHDQMSN